VNRPLGQRALIRRVAGTFAVAALVLSGEVAPAAARSVPVPEAHVEEIALGGSAPTQVLVRSGDGSQWKRRPLTDDEVRWLERLVAAHRRDDLAPFHAALEAPSHWVRMIAVEGVGYARIWRGSRFGLRPMRSVRRADFTKVAALLPAVRDLARAPAPRNELGGPHEVTAVARDALRMLASRPEFPALADEAFAAYLGIATQAPSPELWRGVASILHERPRMTLDETARSAVRAYVLGELERSSRDMAAMTLLVHLDEPALLDRLDAMYEKQRHLVWLNTLARGGHPRASHWVLEALRGGAKQQKYALPGVAAASSVDHLPHLDEGLESKTTLYEAAGYFDALLAIGGPEAAAVLTRYVKARARSSGTRAQELLGRAIDTLVRVDPEAKAWIRPMHERLPLRARWMARTALARAGERDMLGIVEARLTGPEAPVATYREAVRTLAVVLEAPRADTALALVHQLLRRFHPRRMPAAFEGGAFSSAWPSVLQAVREAELDDEVTETLLLEWLSALRPTADTARTAVAMTLAEVGGPRSLRALEAHAGFPDPFVHGLAYIRVEMREHVGRLEQRLDG
jgi:hypothetical protein